MNSEINDATAGTDPCIANTSDDDVSFDANKKEESMLDSSATFRRVSSISLIAGIVCLYLGIYLGYIFLAAYLAEICTDSLKRKNEGRESKLTLSIEMATALILASLFVLLTQLVTWTNSLEIVLGSAAALLALGFLISASLRLRELLKHSK